MRALINAVILVAVSLMLFAAAGFFYLQSHTGPVVQATVEHCETTGTGKNRHTDCTGHWEIGGRRVEGEVENVGHSDRGKTVRARVKRGTAYAESLRLPLILAGMGGFMLLGAIVWGVVAGLGSGRSGRYPPAPPGYPTGPPPPPGYPGGPPPSPGHPGGPPPGHGGRPPFYRPPHA